MAENSIYSELIKKSYIPEVFCNIGKNVADNWHYVYSGMIGASSVIPIPYIGQINPYLAGLMFTIPSVVALQEDHKTTNDPSVKTHYNHEIMTDAVMNTGIYMLSSYMLPKLSSFTRRVQSEDNPAVVNTDMTIAVLTSIIGTTIMVAGDNSPLNNIEQNIVSAFDYVLGDWI